MSSRSSLFHTGHVGPPRHPAIDQNDPQCILPECTLPGFETITLAARGSFAEIWKIQDVRTGDHYALKRLKPDWHAEPVCRQLLANEAHVGGRVESRHVVQVVQAELDSQEPYVLLEWIDGTTLEEKLRAEGRLPEVVAVWIARQCAEGLSDLARAGFAHGDVKPANILVDAQCMVTLIDLGFAKPIDNKRENGQPHLLVGTAEYMAPESLSRGHLNPVSKDMYSLGITLFRMLTGRLPFEAETAADVLRLQRSQRPPRLRRWCPTAPRELAGLVHRLLAKQPIRRPPSLAVLVRELLRLELLLLPHRFAA